MAFYFKNTKKDINMTKKDEEYYRKNNNCKFCEKKIVSDKVRDHCHLTGKYRGSAHSICNKNKQILHRNKVLLIHLYFTILVTETVTHFLKIWLIKKR